VGQDRPEAQDPGKTDPVLAAVDLGSNSFHMVVARPDHGQLVIIDRLREMVRLGAGFEDGDRLSESAIQRALGCLSRFSERLRAMQARSVRAVGTNTLRRADRPAEFLDRAVAALGHDIEVISGVEEARLVYLGAAHSLPGEPGRRLVVDIGGGSTELIVGEAFEAQMLESLYMGCVSVSGSYLPDGVVTEAGFEAARLFARQELEPVAERFRSAGWRDAFGTSGTFRATARQLTGKDNPSGFITRAGLADLQAQLISCGDLKRQRPEGLGPQRAPVYAGGLAIIIEIFDALGIDRMRPAEGALREGLLFDLYGRLTHEDVREQSVAAMQARFHVDVAQAERVAMAAQSLLSGVAEPWELAGDTPRRMLAWAGRLHEIGLDIAHAHHHCHAAYLLRHADLAGFSTGEQRLLAALVGNHRRKLRESFLTDLPGVWRQRVLRLTAVLRLAVVLHRSRSSAPLPDIAFDVEDHELLLRFPTGWLAAHPLTRADLDQEAGYLEAVGMRLITA
jgi:exopolyphosphatase/guanosine-5'-triphosphate,3'-diphosphate pyrophosphatase